MKPEINTQKVMDMARSFRLNWGRVPLSGRIGEKQGNETGSSIEFQDYRPYCPGDDIRHIDWKAYGRSDTLMIRLFREEISPRVDLVVDETSSMAVTGAKLFRLRELTLFFSTAAREARADVRLFGRNPPRRIVDPAAMDHSTAPRIEPWGMLEGKLRRRSLRIIISDFLFPHDPARLLRTFARDAARLCVIQLTIPDETDPSCRGPLRFIEVEDNSQLDIQIGRKEVEKYKERFAQLRDHLTRETARAHGVFCPLSTSQDLNDTARALVRCGILEAS